MYMYIRLHVHVHVHVHSLFFCLLFFPQRPIVEFALEDSRALKLMKRRQDKQVMESKSEGKKEKGLKREREGQRDRRVTI